MAKRINIMIPEKFLEEVDRVAKQEHRTRSAIIRESLQTYIERKKEEKAEQERKQRKLKAARLQDTLAKKAGRWDAVQAVRMTRERSRS